MNSSHIVQPSTDKMFKIMKAAIQTNTLAVFSVEIISSAHWSTQQRKPRVNYSPTVEHLGILGVFDLW